MKSRIRLEGTPSNVTEKETGGGGGKPEGHVLQECL